MVTLTRCPEASNVDTSNGKPNRLSVTVSVPSAFTVTVPPPNKLSRADSNGGVFKTGGVGGEGGEGGECGDEGGEAGGGDEAALTVSVAVLVVALPALLVKIARNSLPFMAAVTLLIVNVGLVSPVSMRKLLPPLLLTYHCTVGMGLPLAEAMKIAD